MRDHRLTGAYVSLNDLSALRFHLPNMHKRRQVRAEHHSSAKVSRHKGRGIDFDEVRLYQAGDDVRAIDWRVTARKNKPHTKLYREERERPTLILIDQSQSLFFGSTSRLKSVAAAELAAIWAWQALKENDRVGAIVIDNQQTHVFKPYRSTSSVLRILGRVAQCNQALTRGTESKDKVQSALRQLARLAHTNYRMILISDFYYANLSWQTELLSLARHNQIHALMVVDPLERNLPPADQYSVTDGKQRLQFHAASPKARDAYLHAHERRMQETEQLFLGSGCRLESIYTNEAWSL